jgi:long-chain fatty acid transport protein
MRTIFTRAGLLGGVAGLALGGAVGHAVAGGFAVREQSTVFQGSSFAGSAAGGALSSMFWNSAASATFKGLNIESSYSYIHGNSEITALPGSTLIGLGTESGNIAAPALVGATYLAYEAMPNIVLSLGMTSPFGLTTKPDHVYAGSIFHERSQIFTINLNPTVAFKLTDWLAVGVGGQVQYFDGTLKRRSGVAADSPNAVFEARDLDIGYTAGIMITPSDRTQIGIGFRSAIHHDLKGSSYVVAGPGAALGSVHVEADVVTPETVTLSLRQGITDRLTFLATAEWTNWSRLEKGLTVVCTNSNAVPVLCPGGNKSIASFEPLGWDDGWIVSAGGEFDYSERLKLRGGLAYEQSPIRSPDERTPRVPDNDRIWASIGASYKWSEATTLDFAYSHVFVEDGRLDRCTNTNANCAGGVRLIGEAETSVDIVSFGMRTTFGAPPAPLK